MPIDLDFLQVAEILEKCARDEADASHFLHDLNLLTFSGEEEIVNEAIHFLNHFASDLDIRSKDDAYNLSQRNQLMDYVNKIRALSSR